MKIDEIVTALEVTPTTLRKLFHGVPTDFVRVNEGPDTFSPYDVIGHLLNGEKTDWIPRLRRIIEHGESKPFDKFDRFAQSRADQSVPLTRLLDDFTEWRENNVAVLKAYAEKGLDFSLKGTHPELGTVTLAQLLHAWILHDWSHIGQIVRVLSKQLETEVGPWAAYFRILTM